MDRSCQDYCLTEDERIAFERDGFFIVQNALDPDRVDRLTRSVDRLDGLFATGSRPVMKTRKM